MLAVSLRDPLRDTLEFRKFAWGVALGCALLLLPLFRFFHYQNLGRLTYTPLFAAFALFVLLLVARFWSHRQRRQSEPRAIPACRNHQSSVGIFPGRLFRTKVGWLRELNQPLPPWPRIPRIGLMLPLAGGVSGALILFLPAERHGTRTGHRIFVFSDVCSGAEPLGARAPRRGCPRRRRRHRQSLGQTQNRSRPSLYVAFSLGQRCPGGRSARAFVMGFSTGGVIGSGPGWGDPEIIPAGHTDLVLPAIGEEWGFVGIATGRIAVRISASASVPHRARRTG